MDTYPIHQYPTGAETDPNVLYSSLGSFWTQLFQDKAILKGYTTGLAEEIIQRYFDLVEVINSYSVKDVPILHREKWFPITIYKSQFNESPLIFNPSDSVFGPQSIEDQYYQNVVFQFGFPKVPVAQVYLYNVGISFQDFGIIADKIISPSNIFVNGTDVTLTDGILYFNTNIFNNSTIASANVISENGNPVTYIDKNGNIQKEEFIILWAYNGQLDLNNLYNTFGYIFDITLPNSQFVKDIIENVFALYVNGPTAQNIISVCSAFLGVRAAIEASETIQEVFSDSLNKWVITDQHVYQFELYHTFLPNIIPGAVVYAGDAFIDSILYYDTVSTPTDWWKSPSVIGSKLALSQYLFLGNYSNQMVLENGIDLVTLDANGNIRFPIQGSAQDVATFNKYLNSNVINAAKIKEVFGLENPGDSAPINPVDFVISTFLKNNLAFIKFKFNTEEIQSSFLSLLPLLKKQLPPYTYIIFDLNLALPNDSYSNLNDNTPITFTNGTQILNSDGSNSVAKIENLAPYNYKDATHRLFSISLAIPTQPYEQIQGNSSIPTTHSMAVQDGSLLFNNYNAGDSTAKQNKLLLIAFT